jgi:single-stranded DNA-specific DHH superfamily exonuclease
VNRILEALEREETILVHGDYDVDGVTPRRS